VPEAGLKAIRYFFVFLFFVAIVFGPAIGVANAVVVYTNLLPGLPIPSPSALSISQQLAKATNTVRGS
jgi:hypothetical protein